MSDYKELCERLMDTDVEDLHGYAAVKVGQLLGEAAEALEALQARVRELQQYHDWAAPQIERPVEQSVIAENNALSAKLAEKDVARYAFLCGSNVPQHSPRWSRWRVEYWSGFHGGWQPLVGTELDSVIDAAIAAGGGDAKD